MCSCAKIITSGQHLARLSQRSNKYSPGWVPSCILPPGRVDEKDPRRQNDGGQETRGEKEGRKGPSGQAQGRRQDHENVSRGRPDLSRHGPTPCLVFVTRLLRDRCETLPGEPHHDGDESRPFRRLPRARDRRRATSTCGLKSEQRSLHAQRDAFDKRIPAQVPSGLPPGGNIRDEKR